MAARNRYVTLHVRRLIEHETKNGTDLLLVAPAHFQANSEQVKSPPYSRPMFVYVFQVYTYAVTPEISPPGVSWSQVTEEHRKKPPPALLKGLPLL